MAVSPGGGLKRARRIAEPQPRRGQQEGGLRPQRGAGRSRFRSLGLPRRLCEGACIDQRVDAGQPGLRADKLEG